ncbi:MAG: efflux RND transporter periplasmic adaptor subunit [Acidobacteriota bacterium]
MNTRRISSLQQACGFIIAVWSLTLLAGGWVFSAPDQHQPNPNPTGTVLSDPPNSGVAKPSEFQGEIVPQPQLVAEVVAPLWGKIYLEKDVYEGAQVKKGQPLARILLELDAVERLALNDRTLDVEQFLEIWTGKARSAWSSYQRALEIGKTNPDFQEEIDRRKKVYDSTLQGLQIANQQHKRQALLLQTRDPRQVIVTSPLSGYVSSIYFVSGDINSFDEFRKLFLIVDLSTVWARADIFEKDLWIVRDAPKAVISTSAFPDQTFAGRFLSLGSEIDPVTRTISAYYEVPNLTGQLKLGMRVRLHPIQE